MKIRAKEMKYNYPYLYDGDEQAASKAYGAAATPHVFILDEERKLRYQGGIDSDASGKKKGVGVKQHLRNAVDEILAGKEVSVKKTRVLGCSTKWAYKNANVKRIQEEWLKKEVTLEEIDEAGLKKIVANKTDKLRLVNVWATWCTTCVTEIPELVTLSRRFAHREFEVITVSADSLKAKARVMKTLKNNSVALPSVTERSVKEEGRKSNNYIVNFDDKDKLAEAIDPEWQGPFPYTLLIAPGGKILWKQTGAIDFMELKKEIIKFRGRMFEWW